MKKKELHQLIDKMNEEQMLMAKEVMSAIIDGSYGKCIPVCDLGSPEDIATLYEAVTYDKKTKV